MAQEAPNRDGLIVVKLSTQKIPEFKEVKNKDWIAYGKDNLYPDYLVSLFERSSTNNAIITGKVNYILGEGWRVAKKGLTLEAQAKLNAFIQTINPEQTLDELSERVALDFEYSDGFYLKVVRNKRGNDFSLHYMPFNKMRTNEDETEFYYSKDWKQKNQSADKTGFKKYPKFEMDGKKPKHSESIYYFRILSPRKGSDPNVYPLPNYIGGTQAIETEIESQNYNLAEIKTGFSAGTMVNFYNGIPTEEQKDDIEDKIMDKFTSTDAAGKIIINFSDGKERGAEVVPLNGNDLPDRYENLKKDSMKSIFTSHKVSSPELFGVQQDGVTFGGRAQIAEQYELFYNTYISKRQRILEKVFNDFASLKGVSAKLMIKPTAAINTDVWTEQTIVNNLPKAAIQDIIAERMGVDLSKYENKGVTTQMESNFHKQYYEDNMLEAFGALGRSRELFDIVKSKDFKFESDEQAEESEFRFAEEEGEDLDNALNTADIARDLARKREKREAKTKERAGQIEVLYSYELRHNAPDLVAGGKTRKFCETLVNMTKTVLFSRSEINRMSNEFNTDVWRYRGGWYTNPRTDVPRPSCRHTWKQHVVKIK